MPVTVADLRTVLGVTVAVVSDDDLADALAAATISQAADCDVPPGGTPDLDRALIRRVGRDLAARGLPLGASTTEYGTAYIAGRDPILAKWEAPYLRGGFA